MKFDLQKLKKKIKKKIKLSIKILFNTNKNQKELNTNNNLLKKNHTIFDFKSELINEKTKEKKIKKVIISCTSKATNKLNTETKTKYGDVLLKNGKDSFIHTNKYCLDEEVYNKLDKKNVVKKYTKKDLNKEALKYELFNWDGKNIEDLSENNSYELSSEDKELLEDSVEELIDNLDN